MIRQWLYARSPIQADILAIKSSLTSIQRILVSISQQGEKIMALVTVESTQVDAVVAALNSLKTDTSKSLADIAAKLQGAVPAADPATAAALTAALSEIEALDATIKAADPLPVTTTPAA